jgi:hypothetical protein
MEKFETGSGPAQQGQVPAQRLGDNRAHFGERAGDRSVPPPPGSFRLKPGKSRELHEPRSRPTTIPRNREEEPIKSRSLKTAQGGAGFFASKTRNNFLGPRNPGKPRDTGRERVVRHRNRPTRFGEDPDRSFFKEQRTRRFLQVEGVSAASQSIKRCERVAPCGNVWHVVKCLARREMSGTSGKKSGAPLPDCQTCRGARHSLRNARGTLASRYWYSFG